MQLRVRGGSARGLWRPIRRFAIWQKGKWRPCDHARESLHNECTTPSESLIHWVDNESAVYSLAKDNSGAADSARVVNLYHACVAHLGVTPWLEWTIT